MKAPYNMSFERLLIIALLVVVGVNAWVKRENTEALEEHTRALREEIEWCKEYERLRRIWDGQ